jgi:predicted branched-subunit amino acid permease
MIAAGAPMWVILAAAFCVNLRFVVFSAHLRPYMMHLPRLRRVVSGFVTGDLSYVFFAKPLPAARQQPRGAGPRSRPT